MKCANYFREQAEQCRRAACIHRLNDPTATSLRALAVEFDVAAWLINAMMAADEIIAHGGDVRADQPWRAVQ